MVSRGPTRGGRLSVMLRTLIMRVSAGVVAMLCMCVVTGTAVAAALIGTPPVEKYSPNIDVDSQNFCITQDSRGIIFVCNASGVIEFDGERWKLHKLANRELVRSLAVDAQDNVYVGGYNLFGVLRRDAAGVATLEDLSAQFKLTLAGREFADIWEVELSPDGVYFRALNDVFFIDPKTKATAHWYSEGKFGLLRYHAGRMLLQFRGEGFKVREGNKWHLLPDTAKIKEPIFQAVSLADQSLLVFGNDINWWRVRGDKVTVQAMPLGTPEPSTILSATALVDGSLVLAGSEGKIFNIDNQLTKTRAFKLEAGMISGVSKEVAGGFLAVADLAIYRVAWPAPWSILGIEQGGGGPLAGFAQWQGKRYALSDAGGFEIIENSDGRFSFAPVSWTKNPIYALHPLDKNRALLSGAHHLMLLENNAVVEIASEQLYPRAFWPSRFHPTRIYLGTEMGLRVLDTTNITPKKIALSAAVPRDIPVQFQSVAEMSKNEIWLGAERHGIWRVQLADDGSVVAAAPLKADAAGLGIKYGAYPTGVITLLQDGTMLASTGAGIFNWDGKQFVSTAFDGLVALRAADETLRLVQAPNGAMWAHSNVRVWRRVNKQDGSREWLAQDIQNVRKGSIADIVFGDDGNAILVNSHGLIMHHPSDAASAKLKKPAQLLLRAVAKSLGDGGTVALPLVPTQPPQFEVADFGIRFDFALPDYARDGARRYQGRLVGDEAAFSEWALSASYFYSALQAGQYAMQIRAKDSDGNITEITPYSFEILPRWYARKWAVALWILLAAGAIAALVLMLAQRRTRSLERRNQSLESKVAARTLELEAANARLENLARLDGLTGVPNRRRLDEYLAQSWDRAQKNSEPLALLVIDADHFKQYNDQHGHQAGDELLRAIAATLSACLGTYVGTSVSASPITSPSASPGRPDDLLARYGGEEFVVVLPNATPDFAKTLAEAMRNAVENTIKHTTISIGVSAYQPSATAGIHSAAQLLSRADGALYAAKDAGRNCVRMRLAP